MVIFYFSGQFGRSVVSKQAHASMERMLKKGDEVITIGGLFGTVSRHR